MADEGFNTIYDCASRGKYLVVLYSFFALLQKVLVSRMVFCPFKISAGKVFYNVQIFPIGNQGKMPLIFLDVSQKKKGFLRPFVMALLEWPISLQAGHRSPNSQDVSFRARFLQS